MLTHPTLEKLHALRLSGMAKGLEEQMQMTGLEELGFVERLGLLVDREMTERENRRLKDRLAKARLRQSAAVEDVDLRTPRGLDRSLFVSLCSCQWISQHLNVLITGKTGTGKSFLACALAQKACREGFTVAYYRVPRLLGDLAPPRWTAGTRSCSPACRGSICWSSTTGASTLWPMPSAGTCWRSWRTATAAARPW